MKGTIFPIIFKPFSLQLVEPMKRIIFLLFLLPATASFAQSRFDSLGIQFFNQGMEFYKHGKIDSCLNRWEYMINKRLGRSYDVYGSAFFNIPTIYLQERNYDSAKFWFLKLLDSHLQDNAETGDSSEPFFNYKHKSAMTLAAIYHLDSNYKAAYEILCKADTLYPYWGIPHNPIKQCNEEANILELQVAELLKMDRKEEAIRCIVLTLITAGDHAAYFQKSELSLFELIPPGLLKADLDKALRNASIVGLPNGNKLLVLNLRGLSYQIPITSNPPPDHIPIYWKFIILKKQQVADKTEIIRMIKAGDFYSHLK